MYTYKLNTINNKNNFLQKRQDHKNILQDELSKWLPDEKIMGLDKESDGLTILRRIGSQKVRAIKQRDMRPHLLADHVEFIETQPVSISYPKNLYFLIFFLAFQSVLCNV